jgi:alanine dehydrogenase
MKRLAKLGAKHAIQDSEPLASAANVIGGKLTYEAVAQAFGLGWTDARTVAAGL